MLTSLHKPIYVLVITMFTLICVSFSYSTPHDVYHDHKDGNGFHTHTNAAELWIDTDSDGDVDTSVDDLTDEQRETFGLDCQQKLNKSQMKSVMAYYLEPLEEGDLDEGYVDTLTDAQKTELRRILNMSRSALNNMNADNLASLVLAGFPIGFNQQDLEDTSKVDFVRELAKSLQAAETTVDQCPNPLIKRVFTDSFHNSHSLPATVYMDPAEIRSPGVGKDIRVEIKIKHNFYRVGGFRGTVNFGNNLSLNTVRQGSYVPADSLTSTETSTSATFTASFTDNVQSGNRGSSDDGTLVELMFLVGERRATTIRLTNFVLSDAEGNSLPVDIEREVSVTHVNEAPAFTDGDNTERSINENTDLGVNIGSAVSATDPENNNLTYTLGGTDASFFSIVSSSGQLRTKSPLNYQTQSTYTVTITVSDGNGGTDTITVTISVTNVNEAPVFTDGDNTTRSIAENTISDQAIGLPVSATDPDDGDTLEYSLGGPGMSSFSIDSSSGQLLTSADLDHETKSSYTVTVTVSDGILSDSITVTINVTDANDAPVFTEGEEATRSIAENTISDQAIGLPVSATDQDNDDLDYILSSADNPSGFLIVSSSGQLLTTPSRLNYEESETYTGTITVSDGNGGTDTITVTISVTNVNEAPVFSETNITRSIVIDGDTAAGASIGEPVSATDPEGDAFTYSLGGTDASFFSIDDSTGQLQATDVFISNERVTYSVAVIATDGSGESASVNVTVTATRTSENVQQNEGTQQQKSVSPPPKNVNTQQQKSVSPPPKNVNTQQQKSNDSVGGEGDSGDSQQQKSNDSVGGEGDSGDSQQQKSDESAGEKITNDDSETSEQPSEDPSEEMPRSNGGNAPRSSDSRGVVDRAQIQAQIDLLLTTNDRSPAARKKLAYLKGLLAAMRPDKTKLLANYPNPFNPETWIPYHLSKASDVQITIYDARGTVVRRLDLGHQRKGYYINRSRAAYWNGKNDVGEKVASGIYFYQLQAGSVSLLRKMVILK